MPSHHQVSSQSMTKYKRHIICLMLACFILLMLIPLPSYRPSFSHAIYAENGALLSAQVSSEEQWCFPLEQDIPQDLATCIVLFEDEYFHYHLGVNPVAILKAAIDNYKRGRVFRGASTIPMQVMRMRSRHHSRSLYNKLYESLAAVKYSILNSKKEVLNDWAEMAPFGGNTVGVQAAALRYFGRSLDNLSWSEYALLAVLPNGPNHANLSKNRHLLKQKRDFLLRKLQDRGHFELSDLTLYLDEELPTYVRSIEQNALHALQFAKEKQPTKYIHRSTIDQEIQHRLHDILDQEILHLHSDDIGHVAVVVLDVKNDKCVAYASNKTNKGQGYNYIDLAQSARSYGSLLKPFLYLHGLDDGHFLPGQLIADIPTYIAGFSPENFDKQFRGAVPMEQMVSQSLNVPAVRMLHQVGLKSFYKDLSKYPIRYLNRGADHYGLSLILGGGELNLWDLANMYKGLSRDRLSYENPYTQSRILIDVQPKTIIKKHKGLNLDYVMDAMSDVNRPREEANWESFGSDLKVAWKTGTSHGHKDAWSIGFDAEYAVAVWVGNADGSGRHHLTGVRRAAPIMFKVFRALDKHSWFPVLPPKGVRVEVCSESGKLRGQHCCHSETKLVASSSHRYATCTHHEKSKDVVAEESCKYTFQLPPHMEYYHRRFHGNHQKDRKRANEFASIIYPEKDLKVFLPKESKGHRKDMVARAHQGADAKLYWYLNDTWIETTEGTQHELPLSLEVGQYELTVIDESGNRDERSFEVIGVE